MKSILVATFGVFTLLLSACNQAKTESADTGAKPSETAGEYPLDVCVVSGKKLGSMGDPYVITHEGQEVRFCCSHCEPKFEKDPASYIAKIKEASK